MPNFTACCLSEPAVRFINLTILATGVLALECARSSLLSCFDQGRRAAFRFFAVFAFVFLAIIVPLPSTNTKKWFIHSKARRSMAFLVTYIVARGDYALPALLTIARLLTSLIACIVAILKHTSKTEHKTVDGGALLERQPTNASRQLSVSELLLRLENRSRLAVARRSAICHSANLLNFSHFRLE
jgi:hypothetical protein